MANPRTETRTARPVRVLAYCHDGVGLGHLRRTLNICEHVGRMHSQTSFLVVTGNPYLSLFDHVPRTDYIKLPSLRKIDSERYDSKFLNLPAGPILRCRESIILETVKHFDPTVLLIDKAPVGVCGELMATLHWVRKHRPNTRVVFGMRDIEDDPTVTIRQWSKLGAQTMLESYFDEVWVYGMRSVFDVAAEYKLTEAIQDKMQFMGYVARADCGHNGLSNGTVSCNGHQNADRYRRQVLVTVGGGTDGASVLDAYLGAAAHHVSRLGMRSLIVAGPDLPSADAKDMRRRASVIPNAEWIDFTSCMNCRIRESDLVVCMGGYNTLCEVVANDKPALVIPRIRPRREQAMRAGLWENRGVVSVLHPASLSANSLSERVGYMLSSAPETNQRKLNLDGLDSISTRFRAILNGGLRRARPIPV